MTVSELRKALVGIPGKTLVVTSDEAVLDPRAASASLMSISECISCGVTTDKPLMVIYTGMSLELTEPE